MPISQIQPDAGAELSRRQREHRRAQRFFATCTGKGTPLRSLLRRLLPAGLMVALLALAALGWAETTLKVIPQASLRVLDPIWTTAYLTRNHGYLVYDTLFPLPPFSRMEREMGGEEVAMRNYVIQRILATIPVMGVVVLFVFLLLRFAPGDPAALIAGDYASPEDIAKIRVALGLDKPVHVQLGLWLAALARADLGTSIYSKLPVTHLMAQRLEPTLALTLTTLVFAVSLAVPLGVLAAWKADTWVDRAVMILAVAGFSLPVFWLGFLLIYGFSITLALLPVQGFVSITEGIVPFLQHMVLPTLTLGTVYMALIARMTRASVLEVLGQDYIRTAHAKGVAQLRVLWRHALKNAAVPIVTVIGIGVALLIGGVVVTESVFAIPGLGRLTVDAILHRDYPVIQGIVLVFSAAWQRVSLPSVFPLKSSASLMPWPRYWTAPATGWSAMP